MCCHRKPGCISLWEYKVQNRGSCQAPEGGPRGDPELPLAGCTHCVGGGHGDRPHIGRPYTTTGTKTEVWITTFPSKVNRTNLGDQEWSNALFLRYFIDPPDLPPQCDGSNANFSICCALDFKKGGFFMNCHNKLHDGIYDLAGKAFTPSHVRDEILIQVMPYGKERPSSCGNLKKIHQCLRKIHIKR